MEYFLFYIDDIQRVSSVLPSTTKVPVMPSFSGSLVPSALITFSGYQSFAVSLSINPERSSPTNVEIHSTTMPYLEGI